jgi:hypothetical protein
MTQEGRENGQGKVNSEEQSDLTYEQNGEVRSSYSFSIHFKGENPLMPDASTKKKTFVIFCLGSKGWGHGEGRRMCLCPLKENLGEGRSPVSGWQRLI